MKTRTIKAVDLFAGAGGASNGLVRACIELGYKLDLLAINHWPVAVETHGRNHPNVVHVCESVDQVDPRQATFVDKLSGRVFRNNGRLDVLLAGPECTHFSVARGGRPVNPQSRASAWSILKWAQELWIDTILIENVPEFRHWGPVGKNGKPLKSKRGETFRAFLAALESFGYRVEEPKILNAADYGDPTTRQRLFIFARRGHGAIQWPAPTHSKLGHPTLFGERAQWTTARERVIDWNVKGKSIFNRKKPLKPSTISRIIAGLKKFGGPQLQPFIIAMEHGGRLVDVDQPLPTITTAKGGAFGVAEPFLVQFKGTSESHIPSRAKSVDEPAPGICGSGSDLGIAEPFLLHATHGGRINSVDDPIPTVTGAKRGEIGVVQPFVLQQQSGGAPRSVDEPVPTICQGGAQALVQPFIVGAGGPERAGEPRSVEQPMNTVLGRQTQALVEPSVRRVSQLEYGRFHCFSCNAYFGVNDYESNTVTCPNCGETHIEKITDVMDGEPFLIDAAFGRSGDEGRAHSVDKPIGAVPGSNRYAVVEPFLVSAGGPEGQGRNANSVDEPLPTVLSENHRALVEPVIVKTSHVGGNGSYVRSVDEPLMTVTGAPEQGIAEAFMVPFYGEREGQDPRTHSVDEPVPTIPGSGDGKFGLVEPSIIKYNGTATGAYSVDDPLDTVPTKDRFGLVEPRIVPLDPIIVPNNTNNVPHSIDEPVPTVTGGNRLGLAEAFISVQKSNSAPRSIEQPIPTLCGGEHVALVEPFLLPPKYQGTDDRVQSVDEPLRTVTGASGRCFGLVQPVINGYVLDIHFRMLQPHELAAAMSFPKDYVFTGTREDVVKQIGNAWAGELSKALCKAAITKPAKVMKKKTKKSTKKSTKRKVA